MGATASSSGLPTPTSRATPVGAAPRTKSRYLVYGLRSAFQTIQPGVYPLDLILGVAIAGGIWLAVYLKGKDRKKFRKDEEYDSARWGTREDIEPFIDPDPQNNVILTATESLTMNSRPKDPKTARNKNVLVIGGSGSGKTRYFLKPNLMQCDSEKYPCSFVVTDPKGTVAVECGSLLLKRGYRIKEIPVQMRSRAEGESSISMGKSVYYMIKVSLAIFIANIMK